MKYKRNIFLLLSFLVLAGCAKTNTSEDSSFPSDTSSQSTPSEDSSLPGSDSSQSSAGSDSSESSESPSEELPPLDDPAIAGFARSEVWPSEALYSVLAYTTNFVMPELTSETSFHHGYYNDDLFYRVLTRVRHQDHFALYRSILEDEYDFSFQLDEYGDTYGESFYGEVKLNMYVQPFKNYFEVAFDFYDGDEYKPKGLVAVDNVASFDFHTQEAVVDRKPTRVKWEVHPVTFTVSKGSAGYSVGNSNYDKITNPLYIYAGNIVNFRVDTRYYISEIKILTSSGYADKFVDQGEFNTSSLDIDVNGDWVTIVPTSELSSLTYNRYNVTNVGATRFVRLTVTIAKK